MKARRLVLPALALAVVAMASTATNALGAFNAKLTSSSSATTNTVVLSDTVTGGTGACASYAAGNITDGNSKACPDSVLPTGTLPSTPTTANKVVTLSNPSGVTTVAPTVSVPTCGLQAALDSRPAGNSGIVHGTVTNGVTSTDPGALTGGVSMGFNGTNAYLATVKGYNNPQNFSVVAWFDFPNNNSSGTILGFTDSHTDSGQANWDRHLFLSAGKLYWGVYNGATSTINGPATGTLAANRWHVAVASVGAAGLKLSIDGTPITPVAVTTAQNFSGYWHIGFGGEASGWGLPAGFNAYWPGQIANVAVIPSQLSDAQAATISSSTTQAAAVSAINAFAPTNFWQLNDAATQTYSGAVPGLTGAPLVDATGGGNTAIISGGVTVAQPGPLGGTSATFDGSSGYLQTSTAYNNPTPLTVTAYFQTTVASGTIFEFANTQAQGPATWDRHVWIDNTGHLVWGVYPNAVQEVTSPLTYNDGNWHQVTVSVGAAGMKMYVDGTLVASLAGVTAPQNFTGYWHIGWGNEQNGWTNPPSNPYWQGSIAHVAVFPAQLTDAQVATLRTPVTSAALKTTILGLTPTVYWPLQDVAAPSTTVCGSIWATVQVVNGSTTCAYPASASACGAPAVSLTGLSTAASLTLGATQTLTFTLTKGSSPPSLAGTHAFATVQFILKAGGFSATLTHVSGPVNL